MRILVVSGQWFPDFAGGTARVVRATAEGLARRGHEVVALVPSVPGESERAAANGVEVLRRLRRSGLPQTFTDVYEVRRGIRELEGEHFDVVLAHGDICATAASAAKAGTPIALVFHASATREARYRRSLGIGKAEACRSRIREPFLWMYERHSMRHARRILVLSQFSRELVLDTDPAAEERVRVVGGGVDTTLFQPSQTRERLRHRLGIRAQETVLVTARRLVGRMGLEMLLHAFSDLRQQRPDARLFIIGEGELRGRLEEESHRLGLDERANFIGRVTDAALRDWYCAADAFALPTLAYEGFGMVTTEALACGTPVVGTRVGATGEILAGLDERLLADGVDHRAFAAAIERTLACATPAFRARCREHVEKTFAWDTVITDWEMALSELHVPSLAKAA